MNIKVNLTTLSYIQDLPSQYSYLQIMIQVISRKSELLKLYPFLDDNGILRVGCRLQNSVRSFDKKTHYYTIDTRSTFVFNRLASIHLNILRRTAVDFESSVEKILYYQSQNPDQLGHSLLRNMAEVLVREHLLNL